MSVISYVDLGQVSVDNNFWLHCSTAQSADTAAWKESHLGMTGVLSSGALYKREGGRAIAESATQTVLPTYTITQKI